MEIYKVFFSHEGLIPFGNFEYVEVPFIEYEKGTGEDVAMFTVREYLMAKGYKRIDITHAVHVGL